MSVAHKQRKSAPHIELATGQHRTNVENTPPPGGVSLNITAATPAPNVSAVTDNEGYRVIRGN